MKKWTLFLVVFLALLAMSTYYSGSDQKTSSELAFEDSDKIMTADNAFQSFNVKPTDAEAKKNQRNGVGVEKSNVRAAFPLVDNGVVGETLYLKAIFDGENLVTGTEDAISHSQEEGLDFLNIWNRSATARDLVVSSTNVASFYTGALNSNASAVALICELREKNEVTKTVGIVVFDTNTQKRHFQTVFDGCYSSFQITRNDHLLVVASKKIQCLNNNSKLSSTNRGTTNQRAASYRRG